VFAFEFASLVLGIDLELGRSVEYLIALASPWFFLLKRNKQSQSRLVLVLVLLVGNREFGRRVHVVNKDPVGHQVVFHHFDVNVLLRVQHGVRIIFWDYPFEQLVQNLNPFLGMSEQGLATSAINLTHVLLLILESSGFLDLAIDYVVLFCDCL
jgi:hypothetical protein